MYGGIFGVCLSGHYILGGGGCGLLCICIERYPSQLNDCYLFPVLDFTVTINIEQHRDFGRESLENDCVDSTS